MATFPLPILPSIPWTGNRNSHNTHFGAPRDPPYPVHGACDLVVRAGTEVLAVFDGKIIQGPYKFVRYTSEKPSCDAWTYAIDVQHETSFVARYCEIAPNLAKGLTTGSKVDEGQVIAFVGAQCGGSMLHFEMFQDTNRKDDLTNGSHATKYLYVPQANYERRNDLLDPTDYLNAAALDLRMKVNQTMDLSNERD
jgi:murein DD-endopeptidase MepM/ murein hydrolase activator NlpD